MAPRPSFARKAVAWLLIYTMSLAALPALANPITAEAPAAAVQAEVFAEPTQLASQSVEPAAQPEAQSALQTPPHGASLRAKTAASQPQIVLATALAIKAVGSEWAVTATVTDGSSQPMANASVHFSVSSGPDAGTLADVFTDPSGHAALTLAASVAGVDVVQASITDDGGGIIHATPLSLQWTAMQGCPSPSEEAPAPAQLAYLGPTTAEYGDSFESSARLTDSLGAPLAAKSVSYALGTVSGSTVTDANGLARIAIAPLSVGSLVLHLFFAGDASAGDATADQTVTVSRDETLLQLGGRGALATGVAQQVTATLFDGVDHAPAPLSGKTITFTINGTSASAVTGADGIASATITIPPSSLGSATLEARFAGDENYLPSRARATAALYVPSGFIIWGGNPTPLKVGQRVNFWGSQWDKQVLAGQYDANAGFKGYSNTTPNVSLCQANATLATLTPSCWMEKDGQSGPPETLPPFIGVAVATAIVKNGLDVYGNVAAIVVVSVEPGYGSDPGKPGFGTIVAVADNSGIIPRPQLAVAQQQPQSVLPGEGFDVVATITNQGSALAHGIHVDAAFDGSTPTTAAASLADLAAHAQGTATFHEATTAPSLRAASESVGAYQLRLATLDGARLSSGSTVTYGGVNGESYFPVNATSSSIIRLPRLFASIAAPSCVTPNQRVTYSVAITNLGSATAVAPALAVTFPDGASATVSPGDIAAGASKLVPLTWTVPAVPAKAADETDAAYRARLGTIDGSTLTFRVAATWSDSRGSGYGDVVAVQGAVERLPILETALATSEAALPATLLSIKATTINRGTGNAIQTDVAVQNPDATTAIAPFTLATGATAERNTAWQVPAPAPKGSAESDTAYRARLAASDNVALEFRSSTTWTDANDSRYGGVGAAAQTLKILPLLGVNLSAPAEVLSGQTLQYTAVVNNDGHAPAATASLVATLPDGSAQTFVVPAAALAVGDSAQVTFSYAVPETHPDGSDSTSVTLRWSDANANTYGPLTATATTTVIRPNQAPVVNAGLDQAITLPATATLSGVVTDDGKPAGAAVTTQWTVVSGPGTINFGNAAAAATTAAFSAPGTYTLRLTASDTEISSFDDVVITVAKANEPPIVNVGPDQSIVLGETATLAGSFADDGLPQGATPIAAWTKVAGPGDVTFGNSATPSTTAAFSAAGSYTLRLTVGDTELTGFDDVVIEVADPNQAPVVDAGPDQSVRLPNSVTLNGSATDDNRPNGTLAISWTRVSGPGTVLFGTPNAAVTTATFSAAGDYVLRLSADDGQLSASDDIAVHASTATLTLTPTAAGPNVTGTTQTMTATLLENGAPLSGQFVQFVIAGANAQTRTATTNASGVASTTYTGTANGSDTIIANTGAGPLLVQSGTSRVDWVTPVQKVSTTTIRGRFFTAPNTGAFTATPAMAPVFEQFFPTINFNPPAGTVPGNTSGINEFTRPMYDVTTDLNGNFTGTILARGNGATLGTNFMTNFNAVFTGTFTVAAAGNITFNFYSDDGFIFGVGNGATRVSGALFNPPANMRTPFESFPVMGAYNTATAPVANSVTVNFPAPGSYPYELDYSECCAGQLAITMTTSTPNGNRGVPPTGSLVISPNSVANPPVGATLNLTVAATDASGIFLANLPVTLTITGANAQVLNGVTGSDGRVAFSYVGANSGGDTLQATASIGATTAYSNTVFVTRGANQAPVVNAGPDQTTTLPVNQVTLSGSYTDDGAPANGNVLYTWSLISGPAGAPIANPNALATTATVTIAGTYTFRLAVSDGAATGADTVVITVNPDPNANKAPVVNAGPDLSITLPATASLNGTVTDDGKPAGAVVSISWSKVSGPGTVAFTPSNAALSTASFSAAGMYVLRLTANDTQLSASDDVTVVVAAANVAPTVNAGPDKSIALPTNSVTLNGSVTDDGKLQPVQITWTMVSGPAAVTFSPANAAVTTATFTATVGTYTLRLSAYDGQYTSTDDVVVTVTPANKPPVVNAGPDQTITRPLFATLAGTVTDDGIPAGAVVTSTWSKVSGPGTVTFGNASSLTTQVSFSASGVYTLRLTANDTQLTAFDDVSITVSDPPAPPTVAITAPLDGATITAPANVTGSVSGGDWKLEYALRTDDSDAALSWTTFATGSGPATSFGRLDPSLLLNGTYAIRLSSTDIYLQTSRITISVAVQGDLKLGEFTISYTDIEVPSPGLPLQIVRKYDTRDKRVGDFGFGWSLGLRNVRLQKNGVLGSGWEQVSSGGSFPTYCAQAFRPHYVTITFPDGRIYKFAPTLSPSCQRLAPLETSSVVWTQVTTGRGTEGASLIAVGADDDVFLAGSVPGPIDLLDMSTADLYNPTVFRLTTAEGYEYFVDQKLGATQITDPSGFTLTINASGVTHSNGKRVAFVRDVAGRITSITDPNGKSIIYTYNAAGDLVSVKDRENNTTTFTYDTTHRLLTIVDPLGRQPVRNDYDSAGRLIQQTDANHQVTTYAPDLDGRRQTITDRAGDTTVIEYDDNGNVLRHTDGAGGVTSYTYDANGNALTWTDPLHHTMTYTYDAVGNRLTETDGAGNKVTTTWNAHHKPLTVTDANHHTITTTYDLSTDAVTSIKDPAGNTRSFVYTNNLVTSETDGLNRTRTYGYDNAGNLTRTTDPTGAVTTMTYDANGRQTSKSLTRTTPSGPQAVIIGYVYDGEGRLTRTNYPDGSAEVRTYDAIGRPATITDPRGQVTTFTYDDMGRLTRTEYPDDTSESATYDGEGHVLSRTDRTDHTTSYEYDGAGRLLRTTYPDGTTETSTYDLAGHLLTRTDRAGRAVETITYDALGRRATTTDAVGNTTTFTYDGANNITAITNGRGNTTSYEYDANNRRVKTLFADGSFATTAYDAAGQVVSRTDAANRTTTYTYDGAGRIKTVTDAAANTYTFAYDERGQRVSMTDPKSRVTRYEYDAGGRRTRRILPLGMAETFTYDAAGNPLTRTDFNGYTTTYSYDALNRLLSKTPDPRLGAGAVQFTYNADGQRATMIDATGTTTYQYDALGRRTAKTTPFGALTYTYDAANNLASTISSHTGGVSLQYGYDAQHRLTTVTDAHGGVTTYSYDGAGNLESVANSNGVTTTYTYDDRERPIEIRSTRAGAPVAVYTQGFGPAGNRTQVTEFSGRTATYDYDELYRLTSESVAGDPAGVNGAVAYTYDEVGNRLTRSSTLAPVPSTTSAYDDNDRLITETFDDNGNVTFIDGQANTYDFEDHLVTRGAVRVVYDGDGNRVAKIVGGTTTYYLVDDFAPTGYVQTAEEIVGNALVRTYAYGLQLIAQHTATSTSYYGYDGQGSVRYLTDAAGVVTDTYDYDAFGVLVHTTGSTPNNILFAGQEYDPDLGVYYLRARYYNAGTGRFWSGDPLEGHDNDVLSLHRYNYAGDDPINKFDPAGTDFSLASVGATMQVMGAVAYQSLVRHFVLNTFLGVATGSIEEYLSTGTVTAGGIFKNAALGAVLGPLFEGVAALRVGRVILSVASFGIGSASAYHAFEKKQYGLAIFYATTTVGPSLLRHIAQPIINPFRTLGKAIFYSGGKAAQVAADRAAAAGVGETIGQTAGGRAVLWWIDKFGIEDTKALWDVASAEFAHRAAGEVHVFLTPEVRPTSTYLTVELPILLESLAEGTVAHIVRHDVTPVP